jgi:hypothetical protein
VAETEYAFVFWRSSTRRGIGDEGHEFGETGKDEATQREADRSSWPIAASRQPGTRLVVAVVDGKVERVWPVVPGGVWERSTTRPRLFAIPLAERQLSPQEVREQYPSLGYVQGDQWPAIQGRIRKFVTL